MKKGPIIISLLVIMVIIGFAYFRLVLSSNNIKPVYDAVPESATLIFEFKDFSKTLAKINKADYAKDILQAGFINKIITHLDAIDKHFFINNFKPTNANEIIATLHLTAVQDYNYLYVIQAEAIDRNEFKAMLLALGEKMKIKERSFKDEKIFDLNNKDGKPFFSVSKVSSLLIISENASLVEEAIIQLKEKKSLLDNKDFQKVKDLAGGESDALLFINFKKIMALQPLLLKDEKANILKNIADFSEWMENDIMLEKQAIIINGYTLFTDAKKSWVAQFASKPSNKLTLTEVIPDETALFMLVSNADNNQYFNELKNRITTTSNLKYLNYFKDFTADEWAFGMTEPLDEIWQNDVYLIVKNTDSLSALNSINSLKKFIEKDTSNKSPMPSGKLKINNLLNDIYGEYLLPIENPYYKVVGNYTLFANDTNTINKLTNSINNDLTLSKNVDYLNFSKNISTSSNLYLYINSTKLSELINSSVSNMLLQQKDNKIYERFSPTSIQFNYEENLFFTNAYIQYKGNVETKTNVLWKTALDTTATMPAFFVKNYLDNEKEIIVQDILNQLYLINKAGKILWKIPLKDKIISSIQQVDFYNNNRLQYIFNTENEIFIIDREGKPVNNYPIALPAKATTGMLLAHYADVNQHRVFVPCENRIYGYELSGKPLIGWNPKSKTGNVTQPMQHHVYNNKDYLVVINEEGKLCAFDRKGENRIAPLSFKESLIGVLQSNISTNQFELVVADIKGTIYKVNELGNIKELKFSDNQNFLDFIYADVNTDGKLDYIFLDSKKLIAYNDSFNIISELNLPITVDAPSISLSRNDYFQNAFLSKANNEAIILQSDGSIFDKFIINSSESFNLGSFNSNLKNIIVTSDKSGYLIAYKLK